ncbi:MAG: hypothetical protein Q7J84_13880 [Sulfuricaulis sp.]|nr:hypothetical protein [Sulfuricaulis sp.]
MNNAKIAKKWLRDTGRNGGVVVLYGGDVAGWMNELRNPDHFEPGCVTVDACGNEYEAVGGNSRDGANAWQPIKRAV